MAPLMRSINRESYSGVFNAMFMGVVRCNHGRYYPGLAVHRVVKALTWVMRRRSCCQSCGALQPIDTHCSRTPEDDCCASQIDIIDTFRRKVLQTDSIYCLKGYNALFEPAPFRHGITHSPAVEAATARGTRRQVAPDLEQGLQSRPGAAQHAAPAATRPARGGDDGARSTAAAAQSYAAQRVRGAARRLGARVVGPGAAVVLLQPEPGAAARGLAGPRERRRVLPGPQRGGRLQLRAAAGAGGVPGAGSEAGVHWLRQHDHRRPGGADGPFHRDIPHHIAASSHSRSLWHSDLSPL